jgi:hypothetical protein
MNKDELLNLFTKWKGRWISSSAYLHQGETSYFRKYLSFSFQAVELEMYLAFRNLPT